VVQVGQDGGHERLQDLLLPDAREEAQRDAADVLVGVLQVVAQVLADQDLCVVEDGVVQRGGG
jgi:hypothetical protein